MSYILDALRRAENERAREQQGVPGLGAQPMAQSAAPATQAERKAGIGLPIGLAALVLAALGAGAWWWSGNRTTPPIGATSAARPVSPPAAPPIAPLPQAPAAPGPAPASLGTGATPVGSSPGMVAQISGPPVAAVEVAAAQARVAAAEPQRLSRPLASAPRAGAAADRVEPGPPQPLAADAPPPQGAQGPSPARAGDQPPRMALSQLAPDLRPQMPALNVGGMVYSQQASQRFVLINGQVVREGEPAAPGVTLERILPKALWLRWRDMRLQMPL